MSPAAAKQPDSLTPLQRTFIALERTRARLAALQAAASEPIAVIGLACRVPGADTPGEFWDLLRNGTDAVSRVPPDRWEHSDYFGHDAAEPGRIAAHSGGFLSQIDRFDPDFFGISAREANAMDPQQRLLLEVGWEALEHAGIAADGLSGAPVGVYMGATSTDYAYLQIAAGDRALLDGHYASGVAQSVLSGRLSYLLGLQGPSLTVDTACSSSLVAVHLACQALRNGDCRMALAGGVNLILSPAVFVALSRAHMLAPDGRCKTFDAAADGFARGEGCGVVALKRRSDALADGDRVLALIRGSAVNQDGPSSSLSAPNGPAQEAVIRQALNRAGLEPSQVGYIEAHGTGTQLGDPLEVGALGAVFGAARAAPLLLGSVKTNIGHLEGAAGITGLIKLVLALQHRTIPPHLHFHTPSPHIPWGRLPIVVPVAATSWPAIDGRRIGGVSAFGFSGTNAHLVVEAAATELVPAVAAEGSWERPTVIALSARSSVALGALARHVSAAAGDARLIDVCRTLNVGRAQFEWRAAIAADSPATLAAGLDALARGATHGVMRSGRVLRRDPPRIAFLFTGQGAQHAGMARGLYEASAVFRAALDECAALAASELARPLLDVVFCDAAALDRTEYTQPALFAIEYALTRLWDACGVRPAVVLGHSVGEYVAACVAGVFSLADGVRLICRRARLMQSLPAGGAMAAVACAPEALIGLLGAELCIAAVNGPAQTVIAGSKAAVSAACEALAARRINAAPLPVSHAFHSHLVEPVLDAFEAAAREATYVAPRMRLISNLTGAVAEADTLATPQYWRRHLRETVRFAEGVRALSAAAPDVCIEIGPHPVLLAFVKAGGALDAATLVPSLRRGQPDWVQFQEGLATVFLQGARINWTPLAEGGRVIDLPTYPFERGRHWFRAVPRGVPGAAAVAHAEISGHPLLGSILPMAVPGRFYEAHLAADRPSFVRDHVALGRVVLPATAYLEMLFAAAADAFKTGAAGPETWVLEDVTISDAMVMPESGGRIVQTVVDTGDAGAPGLRVAISSRLDATPGGDGGSIAGWSRHVTARLRRGAPTDLAPAQSLVQLRSICSEPLPTATFYTALADRGMSFGPAFQSVTSLWGGAAGQRNQFLGEVVLPDRCVMEASSYRIHPALLDGCLQVMAGALLGESDALFLPIAIGAVRVFGTAPQRCFSLVTIDGGDGSRRATVRVFDVDGTTVVELADVWLRRVSRDALARRDVRWFESSLYRTVWRRATLVTPATQFAGERQWMILADADAGGCAAALAARLAGAQVVRANELDDAAPPSPVLRATDVIDLRALDTASYAGVAAAAVGVCAMVQALTAQASASHSPAPERRARLWIVTAGAQAVTGAEASLSPRQAAVWGIARTARLEHPELCTVCIDLDPEAPLASLPALMAELHRGGPEPEIAVRANECWVSRLVRHRLEPADAVPGDQCRWVPRTDGTFEHFVRQPLTRRRPAAGEVEIAVHATGLNFRDVLNVLGMYPGVRPALGGECAGVVSAVGDGVTHLEVGQRVLALAADTLASHVIARAAMVRALPPGVGMDEAASFPIAFVTAEYCLLEVARLQAGERVLIHAGAGGVGMAAIRTAQRIGAEVFATAGSPAKRDVLRSLGVGKTFDSRSPTFADELLAATGGHGVDVVLNSLSGEMLDASLRVVARRGRFIEIGKRGIKTPAEVAALGRDIAYHIVDWGDASQADPVAIEAILGRAVDSWGAGRIAPLPRHVFPVDEAPRAFRLMAAGRHVGRIVLRHPGPVAERHGGGLRRDGTYLVTGGLSGLGLLVAQWLGESGAGRLVLIGRRGATQAAAPVIAQLRAAGITVLTEALDVSDEAALGSLLMRLRVEGPPLRGVVHAAAVLENTVILKQDAAQCKRVMAPKLEGAEALDRLTRPDPLDFLVLFSSIAGVLGAPGQANYAAANLALDLVATRRRRDGLPALAISWGAWSGTGVAADSRTASWVADQGLCAMTPTQGLCALERLLAADIATVAVAPLDWPRYVERVRGGRTPAFLTELLARTDSSAAPDPGAGPALAGIEARRDTAPPIRARLAAAPAAGRRALLEVFLRERVSRALGTDPARAIDDRQPLGELGLDSLLAIELRNTLASALGRTLPATLLFDHPSVAQLTDALLIDELGTADVSPARSVAAQLVSSVAGMSDEEVELQLAARRRGRTGS
jgi:acyl transferase domain-containing protein/NADP-dependent 3-hydroxy acid dehydrogenase YdfG/acyl carrier protein